MKPLLIVVVGPTAIGKTALSIALAKALNTEIISSDSRQFYKELAIGTAKPTEEERAEAVHHFVDFLSINEEYSAGQFERDVIAFLDNFFKTKSCAVMVGGSGLFVKAVIEGLDDLPRNTIHREALNERFEKDGIAPLLEELKSLDPKVHDYLDVHNPQRVIRALEVCLASGKPYSAQRLNQAKERPFDVLLLGLSGEREWIYERINQRTLQMMEEGFLDEARSVFEYRNLNALKTVGYTELFAHLNGEYDLERAVELIQQNTRRFAKRQLTWFKKSTNTHWMDAQKPEDIVSWVKNELANRTSESSNR